MMSHLGEGLPALPAGKDPPPRTGTATAYTGTYALVQPHPLDLVGPLPATWGFTHLFIIVGIISPWPEAIPITVITAVDCMNALFQG